MFDLMNREGGINVRGLKAGDVFWGQYSGAEWYFIFHVIEPYKCDFCMSFREDDRVHSISYGKSYSTFGADSNITIYKASEDEIALVQIFMSYVNKNEKSVKR